MKTIRNGLFALAGIGLLATAAQAGEKMIVTEPVAPAPVCDVPFTGSVSVGYETTYLFRGVDFGSHAPWGSIDLNCAINDALSVDFGAWYINPTQDPVFSDELDVYAFLNFPLGPFEAFIGATWFYYAEIDDEALEGNFGLSYSVGELLDLGFLTAYDETADGWYFEANASKSIRLTDCLNLGLAGGLSYATEYYGVDGWNHAYVTAGLSYALTHNATLDVYIGGNFPLEELEAFGEDDDVHGGVSVTVGF